MNISVLAKKIEQEVTIINGNVEPIYRFDLKEIRYLSDLCLDHLYNLLPELLSNDILKNKPKTKQVFENSLIFLKTNINKNNFWSFWHYTSLCCITCFSYQTALSKNLHKTINLGNLALWDKPEIHTPVLTINYIAGILYPNSLPKIIKISDHLNGDIETLLSYFQQKINNIS